VPLAQTYDCAKLNCALKFKDKKSPEQPEILMIKLSILYYFQRIHVDCCPHLWRIHIIRALFLLSGRFRQFDRIINEFTDTVTPQPRYLAHSHGPARNCLLFLSTGEWI
jgi:hypothetical protein